MEVPRLILINFGAKKSEIDFLHQSKAKTMPEIDAYLAPFQGAEPIWIPKMLPRLGALLNWRNGPGLS